MGTEGAPAEVSDDGKKQHSAELAKSLALAAKSLRTRPDGLRGPFVVKNGLKEPSGKK